MDTNIALDSGQKRDIERVFNRLIQDAADMDDRVVLRAARKKLERLREQEVPAVVEAELEFAHTLIAKLDKPGYGNSLSENDRRVMLAALSYLVDPWDLIPDSIPGFGLVDDAYVLQLAAARINPRSSMRQSHASRVSTESPAAHRVGPKDAQRNSEAPFLYSRLPRGAGQHFARRAKELGLLTSYTRRALFDISAKSSRGVQLSMRQAVFLDALLEQLLEEGLQSRECSDAGCLHCKAFTRIAAARAST